MATTIPAPLAGKTAIITGGSRGIGAGIALDLAQKGCTAIAITYVQNKSAAEKVLDQIRQIHPAIKTVAVQADLGSPTFGADVVAGTLQGLEVSKVDIVVCNAAMADFKDMMPLASHTKEGFDAMMTQNVWSPLQLALAALPHMSRGGRVINISSIASKKPAMDPTAIYAASKSALDSVTRSMANIFASQRGVTFNTVSVGVVNTDAMADVFAANPDWKQMAAQMPTAEKRVGEVDDVVQVVAFLCSEGSRWINGNYVPANGGMLPDVQG